MSDTTLRVLFAFILIAVSSVVIYLGALPSKIFVLLIGMVVIDELVNNFVGKKRFSGWYLITQLLFMGGYGYLAYSEFFLMLFVWIAVIMNLILLVYLFGSSTESTRVKDLFSGFPALIGLYMMLSLLPIAWMMSQENYVVILVVYFLINFGMDTGGWFFGKNWGRRKLWERISPKKTVEGLIGGISLATVLGCIAVYWHFSHIAWYYLLLFAGLAALSQIGDLVQSKVKRQFGLKDSSNLIPGHGGAFDRIDSLIFMAPFFAVVLNYL